MKSLDQWLRGRARNNELTGASRTMVSVTDAGRVAGYYCLSASALQREEAPAELGKGQPDPIPVILIGRLAVDLECKGRGLGVSLLQHATVKAIQAAEIIGTRAILVHALTPEVVPFYERFGFTKFPGTSHTLYLLLDDARATIAST
ncbi:GNAT family N-acetyltransferase [Microbacterium marinilacus]|nr:GNAT family N-acetyltransferase [Microbacterium marinilacus]